MRISISLLINFENCTVVEKGIRIRILRNVADVILSSCFVSFYFLNHCMERAKVINFNTRNRTTYS